MMGLMVLMGMTVVVTTMAMVTMGVTVTIGVTMGELMGGMVIVLVTVTRCHHSSCA